MTALELSHILLKTGASIIEAVRTLELSPYRIVLVVDGKGRLLGSITDGDVRRGVLKGVGMEAPLDTIMHSRPFSAPHMIGDDMALALMRQNGIKHLPLVDDEGRVIDIKILDILLGVAGQPNWVVLMAGGKGTRLRPLTQTVPKPMLAVGPKPLLETTIENFVRAGFRQFFISVNYYADVIKAHFGDGASFGVRIDYLEEQDFLGTAGSLRLLPSRPQNPLIVMNGDILTSVDFIELLRFHDVHQGLGTMCVRDYQFQIPYGVVEIEESRLRKIVEKPSSHHFVNAGIYALAPEALDLLPPQGACTMPELFETMIAHDNAPGVFPIREYWMDIGQSADLERARQEYNIFFS